MEAEKFNDYISKGISLMSVESYLAAKEEFEKAIQINERSFEAYIHLGNACANIELFDEAMSAFKNALIIDPSSGEALYSIGNIHLLKDEKVKAVEYYNKAEAAGFRHAELYQILAGIFFEANDVSQALRNITRAIMLSPFDGELYLFKAQIYLAENKNEQALETLDEMQKVLPDAFAVYGLKAQIYCRMGNGEKALEVSEEGCKRFPDDVNLSLSKLKALVDIQKDEEAIAFIEKMKQEGKYEKNLKGMVLQESILFLRKNDLKGALEILQNANEALDGDVDIVYLILDIYGKSENYEKILEMSEVLIGMEPEQYYESTARYFHAYALDKLGKNIEAKEEYRKLTSILRKMTIKTPAFYEGYIYRILSHTQLEEYDRALELTDYVENLHPESADAHTFRYFIYKKQGEEEKAEMEKYEALKINPDISL